MSLGIPPTTAGDDNPGDNVAGEDIPSEELGPGEDIPSEELGPDGELGPAIDLPKSMPLEENNFHKFCVFPEFSSMRRACAMWVCALLSQK